MGVITSTNKGQLVLASLLLFIVKCISETQAEFDADYDFPFDLNNFETKKESIPDSRPDQFFSNNANLDEASAVLTKLLLMPWPKGKSPLLYVEKPGSIPEELENLPYDDFSSNEIEFDDTVRPASSKRSKYYRKYPWKRQQNNIFPESTNDVETYHGLTPLSPKRSGFYSKKCHRKKHSNKRYEPSYLCTPNKDDIYRLLVAIHGERDGYKGQQVNFCNRKRLASLVFTNIRYVG